MNAVPQPLLHQTSQADSALREFLFVQSDASWKAEVANGFPTLARIPSVEAQHYLEFRSGLLSEQIPDLDFGIIQALLGDTSDLRFASAGEGAGILARYVAGLQTCRSSWRYGDRTMRRAEARVLLTRLENQDRENDQVSSDIESYLESQHLTAEMLRSELEAPRLDRTKFRNYVLRAVESRVGKRLEKLCAANFLLVTRIPAGTLRTSLDFGQRGCAISYWHQIITQKRAVSANFVFADFALSAGVASWQLIEADSEEAAGDLLSHIIAASVERMEKF